MLAFLLTNEQAIRRYYLQACFYEYLAISSRIDTCKNCSLPPDEHDVMQTFSGEISLDMNTFAYTLPSLSSRLYFRVNVLKLI